MIYFIGEAVDSGAVKIGFASGSGARGVGAVRERLSALQTGNPRRLVVLASFEGRRETEQRLHVVFGSSRLQGEWFSRTRELESLISSGGDHPLMAEPTYPSRQSDAVGAISSEFVRSLFGGR